MILEPHIFHGRYEVIHGEGGGRRVGKLVGHGGEGWLTLEVGG